MLETRRCDEPAREAIRTCLDQSLVVEAAAGTGKTTALVGRLVALLAEGRATVDRVAAVTFTTRAAGELKLRLRTRLEEARRVRPPGDEVRNRLEQALAHLEEARIHTIHGFCCEILRERPVEARVDPYFQTLTEGEARRLYEEAFSLWFQERLDDPPEGVRRSLRRSVDRFDESPIERLRQAGWELVGWRDYDRPWRRVPFARREELQRIEHELADFAQVVEKCSQPATDRFYADMAPLRTLTEKLRLERQAGVRDEDGLEADLADLAGTQSFRAPWRGTRGQFGGGLSRQEVLDRHQRFRQSLEAFCRRCDADLAYCLQQELRATVERYEHLLARLGKLDFLDLLLRARDLLRGHSDVRADLQQRLDCVFVDEFQDTDPLQAEVLMLLACGDPAVSDWRAARPAPGKLFVVGDPKQSIYRFRRADVGVYLEVRDRLLACGAKLLHLTTSFRSVPDIQRAVNSAFEEEMAEDPESLQAGYVPLSPWREAIPGQPSVIALPVPRPYGSRGVTATAIDQCLPEAVGGFVQWLVQDSGWKVHDPERGGELVPLEPQHVCLLFRRFSSRYRDYAREYAADLESRGIPQLLVGGRGFHDREEVAAVRTAITAVEWPDDELSIFSTLRGPLFGIGDNELLEYRLRHGRLHPFQLPERPLPERLQPVVDTLGILARLHRRRNHRPIADTVEILLEETRAYAGFVLRPAGEQALANVLHLAQVARSYEANGGGSFRGFVEFLREQAGRGEDPEAPVLEEGSAGVRLMTVHAAKGLEFPVVILADLTCSLKGWVSRTLDSEKGLCAFRVGGWAPDDFLLGEAQEQTVVAAEGVRLAYVAATRARDLLVAPAVGDERFEKSWCAPLNSSLYPPRECAPEPGPGCPSFGSDTVLSRPFALEGMARPVRPGCYELPGGHRVTWWDPVLLRPAPEQPRGMRHEELLSRHVDEAVVEEDLVAYDRWHETRKDRIARASTASLQVCRATTLQGTHLEGGDIEVIELPRERIRPAGRRFGTLVHEVLAGIPLDCDSAAVESAAVLHGRILGAKPSEVRAAAAVVREVLESPVLEGARGAAELRRETPVAYLAPEGVLVEGTLDLAFRDDAGWTVVDFKTDQDFERNLPDHRRQLAAYLRAVGEASQLPVRGILLRL
ncbi:MAG: UvrD-helicase domain-containing protein [Armatimonadetes bacterium]|nr:UvrD-helicase domain-containing protein [Armatimonadota bacterium]